MELNSGLLRVIGEPDVYTLMHHTKIVESQEKSGFYVIFS